MDDPTSEALTDWKRDRDSVLAGLVANRERRTIASRELEAARAELDELLAEGCALHHDVTALTRAAGLSRETVHKRLREAGVPSSRGRHRLVKEAGIPSGPARARWFAEKGWAS